MVELDDFDLWPPPEPRDKEPKKCRRHRWVLIVDDEDRGLANRFRCLHCPAIRDEERARRGKNNRTRGNAIEREVGKRLGLRRVGQFGGPEDLSNALFAAQVKSGGSFSERYWQWLKAVPVHAGQTALLVVTDAPGPGHRRRAVVVLDLDDWRALHGEDVA